MKSPLSFYYDFIINDEYMIILIILRTIPLFKLYRTKYEDNKKMRIKIIILI